MATGLGDVAFTAPIAYQQGGGGRIPVDVRYQLDAGGDPYGFAVGTYDRTRPLIIDPIVRSTYAGGGATERQGAAAIRKRRRVRDGSDNVTELS